MLQNCCMYSADYLLHSNRGAAEQVIVYVLEFCRPAAEMMLQNRLQMLHSTFEVSWSSLCFRVLQICCSPAAEMLQTCCRPASEELQNHLQMLNIKFEVSRSNLYVTVLQACFRPAAGMLHRCCKSNAALLQNQILHTQKLNFLGQAYVLRVLQTYCCPVLQRSCRITCRYYIPNLKFLGQVFVLECCRPAAVPLQRYCRPAGALLQRSCRITQR